VGELSCKAGETYLEAGKQRCDGGLAGWCYFLLLCFPLGVPLVFLLPALFFFIVMGSFISSDLSPSLYCVLFRSLCLRSRDESKAGSVGFLLFPFLSLCFRSFVSWVFFFSCVLAFFSLVFRPLFSPNPPLSAAIPSPFIRLKSVVTASLLNSL